MPVLENPKHEKFCQLRASGKTLEAAYVEAGYKADRKHAQRLATNGGVAARLKELQATSAELYVCTAESMARQFDEDRALAIEFKQMGAAVAAGVAKSKLFGLTVERANVHVTHNYTLMTEEELRFEIAAVHAEIRQIKAGVQN